MPLHKGHELVLDLAFSDCEKVTIVVYDTTVTGHSLDMPISKRIDWLEHLYPDAEAIVPIRDYIFDGSNDEPRHAQTYADQLVDVDRTIYPCSGTQIRNDLYENKMFVHPYVYASLIQRVVFVGTESTGKSTLARAMAEEHNTAWVHEYGRELWEAQNLQGSFSDMLKIGREQLRREDICALYAKDYLFCDTNAWTTYQWSLMAYGKADPRLRKLAADRMKSYQWVVCDNDFGWIQDGTRELDGQKSIDFHKQQLDDLDDWGIHYVTVGGSIEFRIEQVNAILRGVKATHAY
jgi:NadR type nicotinamide-nucleotide adenylyltransferase